MLYKLSILISFTSRSLLMSCASYSAFMNFNTSSFFSFLSDSKSSMVEVSDFYTSSKALSFILIFSCIFSSWPCIYRLIPFKFSNSSNGTVSFCNSFWSWPNFSFLLLYFFYRCSYSLTFFAMSISDYWERAEILYSCMDSCWFSWLNTTLCALSCWTWASMCCSKSNSFLL